MDSSDTTYVYTTSGTETVTISSGNPSWSTNSPTSDWTFTIDGETDTEWTTTSTYTSDGMTYTSTVTDRTTITTGGSVETISSSSPSFYYTSEAWTTIDTTDDMPDTEWMSI